jgi:hypothetical protein
MFPVHLHSVRAVIIRLLVRAELQPDQAGNLVQRLDLGIQIAPLFGQTGCKYGFTLEPLDALKRTAFVGKQYRPARTALLPRSYAWPDGDKGRAAKNRPT